MKIHSTVICEHCGIEYPSGLMMVVNHTNECVGGAPNSSIDHHERMKELEEIGRLAAIKEEQEELEFKPIFDRMTHEEHMEAVIAAFPIGCDITMGMTTYENAMAKKAVFKQKMIAKYGKHPSLDLSMLMKKVDEPPIRKRGKQRKKATNYTAPKKKRK